MKLLIIIIIIIIIINDRFKSIESFDKSFELEEEEDKSFELDKSVELEEDKLSEFNNNNNNNLDYDINEGLDLDDDIDDDDDDDNLYINNNRLLKLKKCKKKHIKKLKKLNEKQCNKLIKKTKCKVEYVNNECIEIFTRSPTLDGETFSPTFSPTITPTKSPTLFIECSTHLNKIDCKNEKSNKCKWKKNKCFGKCLLNNKKTKCLKDKNFVCGWDKKKRKCFDITSSPTTIPTSTPTTSPITLSPTTLPTTIPTSSPTNTPSRSPLLPDTTFSPTTSPLTSTPSALPTKTPTNSPLTSTPTNSPLTTSPTLFPTRLPTIKLETRSPITANDTLSPTNLPTFNPTYSPSTIPTLSPTQSPVIPDLKILNFKFYDNCLLNYPNLEFCTIVNNNTIDDDQKPYRGTEYVNGTWYFVDNVVAALYNSVDLKALFLQVNYAHDALTDRSFRYSMEVDIDDQTGEINTLNHTFQRWERINEQNLYCIDDIDYLNNTYISYIEELVLNKFNTFISNSLTDDDDGGDQVINDIIVTNKTGNVTSQLNETELLLINAEAESGNFTLFNNSGIVLVSSEADNVPRYFIEANVELDEDDVDINFAESVDIVNEFYRKLINIQINDENCYNEDTAPNVTVYDTLINRNKLNIDDILNSTSTNSSEVIFEKYDPNDLNITDILLSENVTLEEGSRRILKEHPRGHRLLLDEANLHLIEARRILNDPVCLDENAPKQAKSLSAKFGAAVTGTFTWIFKQTIYNAVAAILGKMKQYNDRGALKKGYRDLNGLQSLLNTVFGVIYERAATIVTGDISREDGINNLLKFNLAFSSPINTLNSNINGNSGASVASNNDQFTELGQYLQYILDPDTGFQPSYRRKNYINTMSLFIYWEEFINLALTAVLYIIYAIQIAICKNAKLNSATSKLLNVVTIFGIIVNQLGGLPYVGIIFKIVNVLFKYVLKPILKKIKKFTDWAANNSESKAQKLKTVYDFLYSLGNFIAFIDFIVVCAFYVPILLIPNPEIPSLSQRRLYDDLTLNNKNKNNQYIENNIFEFDSKIDEIKNKNYDDNQKYEFDINNIDNKQVDNIVYNYIDENFRDLTTANAIDNTLQSIMNTGIFQQATKFCQDISNVFTRITNFWDATPFEDLLDLFSTIFKAFSPLTTFLDIFAPVLDPIEKLLNKEIKLKLPWICMKDVNLCITYPCGVRTCSKRTCGKFFGKRCCCVTWRWPCGIDFCRACKNVRLPVPCLKEFKFTVQDILELINKGLSAIMKPFDLLVQALIKALNIKLPSIPGFISLDDLNFFDNFNFQGMDFIEVDLFPDFEDVFGFELPLDTIMSFQDTFGVDLSDLKGELFGFTPDNMDNLLTTLTNDNNRLLSSIKTNNNNNNNNNNRNLAQSDNILSFRFDDLFSSIAGNIAGLNNDDNIEDAVLLSCKHWCALTYTSTNLINSCQSGCTYGSAYYIFNEAILNTQTEFDTAVSKCYTAYGGINNVNNFDCPLSIANTCDSTDRPSGSCTTLGTCCYIQKYNVNVNTRSCIDGIIWYQSEGLPANNKDCGLTRFTNNPTVSPTKNPTALPTATPTKLPTKTPSKSPTVSPSKYPSFNPTVVPSFSPTTIPTISPSTTPTISPTKSPSTSPTVSPSYAPSTIPSLSPSESPILGTKSPTESLSPSKSPITSSPTLAPTLSPTTTTPSISPTLAPTLSPTIAPTDPTVTPSASPAAYGTKYGSCQVPLRRRLKNIKDKFKIRSVLDNNNLKRKLAADDSDCINSDDAALVCAQKACADVDYNNNHDKYKRACKDSAQCGIVGATGCFQTYADGAWEAFSHCYPALDYISPTVSPSVSPTPPTPGFGEKNGACTRPMRRRRRRLENIKSSFQSRNNERKTLHSKEDCTADDDQVVCAAKACADGDYTNNHDLYKRACADTSQCTLLGASGCYTNPSPDQRCYVALDY